ncbi:MAG: insulinase family protein [Firmicutes bacterium]|nr:insulinase family protein [Bacillota bacterium]
MKKIASFFLFFLVFIVFLSAGTSLTFAASSIYKDTLDNGLTVIVQEVHSSPLVSVNIFVRAGGFTEDSKISGISHFYEHLFFRGTGQRTGAQMKSEIESLGGQTNAETTKDMTHFYINIPSKYWREAVEILADSLKNNNFEADEVDQERKVVLDEMRLTEESPSSYLANKLFTLAYQVHPYKMSVIGTMETVGRLNRDDFIAYKKRFYVPQNTIVLIIGDVKRENVLSYLKKQFADYKSDSFTPPEIPEEPPLTGNIEKVVEKRTKNAMFAVAYRAPGIKDREDIYALDVLTFMMGEGSGAILNREIEDKEGLVWSIGADFQTMKYPGLFMITANLPPENVDKAKTEVFKIINDVKAGKFSDTDILRAKNFLINTYEFGNETNAGKASTYGFYETVDSVDFANTYLDNISRVNRKRITEVANKYFTNYVYLLIKPRSEDKE